MIHYNTNMKKADKTTTNLPTGPEIVYDDLVFTRVEDLDDFQNTENIKVKKHENETTTTTTTKEGKIKTTNLPAGSEIVYDDLVFARVEDLDDLQNSENIKVKKHENETTTITTTTTKERKRRKKCCFFLVPAIVCCTITGIVVSISQSLLDTSIIGIGNESSSIGAQTPSSTSTELPSSTYSQFPSDNPFKFHSSRPSALGDESSSNGTQTPSSTSTELPSGTYSQFPSDNPSKFPLSQPSAMKSITPSKFPSSRPSALKSITPSKFPSPSAFNCIDLCLEKIQDAECPDNPSNLNSCRWAPPSNVCIDDEKCKPSSNSHYCKTNTGYQVFRRITCPINQTWKLSNSGLEFHLEENGMTWEMHQKRALNHNASLASIKDQSEFDFVINILNNDSGMIKTYIGGVRKNENGDPLNDGTAKYWKWIDNSTWSITKWDDGEPNGEKLTEGFESVVIINQNLKMQDVTPNINVYQGLYKRKFVGNYPIEIIAGGSHMCALTLVKELYCWGRNDRNQLGDGTTGMKNTPTKINFENGRKASKVYLGWHHSCALLDDGELQCWGYNNYGQVGNNASGNKKKPTKISIKGGSSITHMALSLFHTCAVFEDGTIYCWGHNDEGQLGDKTREDKKVPTASIAVENKVVQVAMSWKHTCVITQYNSLQCWGWNYHGQLGDNSTTITKLIPTEVSIEDGKAVMQVVTGWCRTCALTVDGILYCWGYNRFGQLGDGTTITKRLPQKVIMNNGKKIKQVASIHHHTCVISDDNTVWCWGYNEFGQLGDGTQTDRFVPTKIDIGDERAVTQIVVGRYHTCVRLDDDAMKCWGSNHEGQLGTVTNTKTLTDASKAQTITFPST